MPAGDSADVGRAVRRPPPRAAGNSGAPARDFYFLMDDPRGEKGGWVGRTRLGVFQFKTTTTTLPSFFYLIIDPLGAAGRIAGSDPVVKKKKPWPHLCGDDPVAGELPLGMARVSLEGLRRDEPETVRQGRG